MNVNLKKIKRQSRKAMNQLRYNKQLLRSSVIVGAVGLIAFGIYRSGIVTRLRERLNQRAQDRSRIAIRDQGITSSGMDLVDETSEESFPASDSPSWNRGL